MRKDIFGFQLKEGDLVVSMANGRHNEMRKGIVMKSGSIHFGGLPTGGARYMCHVDTSNRPDLEEFRLNLIENRKKAISERDAKKVKRDNDRIKPKDLKIFSVYESDNSWPELRLGKCEIEIKYSCSSNLKKVYKNAWVRMGGNCTPYISVWGGSIHGVRDCKAPIKTQCRKSYSKEEVLELLKNFDNIKVSLLEE